MSSSLSFCSSLGKTSSGPADTFLTQSEVGIEETVRPENDASSFIETTWHGRKMRRTPIPSQPPLLSTFFSHRNLYPYILANILEIDDLANLSVTCRDASRIHNLRPLYLEVIHDPLRETSQGKLPFPNQALMARCRFLDQRTWLSVSAGEVIGRYAQDKLFLPLEQGFSHRHLYAYCNSLKKMTFPSVWSAQRLFSNTLTRRHALKKKFESVDFLSLRGGLKWGFARDIKWSAEDWNDPTGTLRIGAAAMFPNLRHLSLDCEASYLAEVIDCKEWFSNLPVLTLKRCFGISDGDEFLANSYPLQVLNLQNCEDFRRVDDFLKACPELRCLSQLSDSSKFQNGKLTLTTKLLQALRVFSPHLTKISLGSIDICTLDKSLYQQIIQPGALSLDSVREFFPPDAFEISKSLEPTLKKGEVSQSRNKEDELKLFQERFGEQASFVIHFFYWTTNSSGHREKRNIWKNVEGFLPSSEKL